MKQVALIVASILIGTYGYKVLSDNPSVITNPVYMESRVNMDIPNTSREVEFTFIGEMASQDDCTKRSRRYLDELLEKCDYCRIKPTECKTDIDPRYKNLFSNQKTHTTYLSLTKGSRFERNGRMVVWGLSDEEADFVCREIKAQINEEYTGTAKCIR